MKRPPISSVLLAVCMALVATTAKAVPISTAVINNGGTEQVRQEDYGNPVTTGLVELVYQGTDPDGNPADMVYTGQASASASYTFLKASAQSSIQNLVNSPGNPEWYSATGQATLFDNLIIGNPNVKSVRFGIQIDGTLSRTTSIPWADTTAGASIRLSQNNVNIWYKDVGQGSSFDEYVMTNPIPVSGGRATLNLYLQAGTVISTSYYEQQLYGGAFSASSNFENTASLVEVFGYDSTGTRVASSSAFSSAGTTYSDAAITPVPEPGSLLMMAFGLIAVVGAAKKRRGNDA
jgi:hypothetical protein